MTERDPTSPTFVRGNDTIDRLAADPFIADDIAATDAEVEEMDRIYAMNLAMIRKAAQMTQVEVARKLGIGQGVVSRLERRSDMLLSTLYDYLTATGRRLSKHRRDSSWTTGRTRPRPATCIWSRRTPDDSG